MKLKDVYALPATLLDLNEGHLRVNWFPEISDASYFFHKSAFLSTLFAQGRFALRQLHHENFDGERTASMHTLWFDGKPVAIVKDAGRGEADENTRWVTDRYQFAALCAYISEVMDPQGDESDFIDPEKEMYPDEVFALYGGTISAKFGIAEEPVMPGLSILWEFGRKMRNVPTDHELVLAEHLLANLPMYIRRGGYILRFVRGITEQEKLDNPQYKLTPVGEERFYWYAPCERPSNDAVVVRI